MKLVYMLKTRKLKNKKGTKRSSVMVRSIDIFQLDHPLAKVHAHFLVGNFVSIGVVA
jgi:hypothetical protein